MQSKFSGVPKLQWADCMTVSTLEVLQRQMSQTRSKVTNHSEMKRVHILYETELINSGVTYTLIHLMPTPFTPAVYLSLRREYLPVFPLFLSVVWGVQFISPLQRGYFWIGSNIRGSWTLLRLFFCLSSPVSSTYPRSIQSQKNPCSVLCKGD